MAGSLPEKWKGALVRLLNKIPSPDQSQVLRPINILPPLSKGVERSVYNQILFLVSEFLHSRNVFNMFQSGFRSSHSTETALLRITDNTRIVRLSWIKDCTVWLSCIYSITVVYTRQHNTIITDNVQHVIVVPYCDSVNSSGLVLNKTLNWTDYIIHTHL